MGGKDTSVIPSCPVAAGRVESGRGQNAGERQWELSHTNCGSAQLSRKAMWRAISRRSHWVLYQICVARQRK